MTQQRFEFKNRHGLKIVGVYEEAAGNKGLAFVCHGSSGFKEQPHVAAMGEALRNRGISTVIFDGTHSFGESDGDLINQTLTSHYQDLEDTIAWSEKQPWFQAPFILAGHSLGGGITLKYAYNYPEKIKAIAPTSTVLSGKLYKGTKDPESLKEWQERGYYEKTSKSNGNKHGKVGFELFEDMMSHDLLESSHDISVPTLLVVGENDDGTPPEHQQMLYDRLTCPKELHIIKDCGHTFRAPEHLAELKSIFDQWLAKII